MCQGLYQVLEIQRKAKGRASPGRVMGETACRHSVQGSPRGKTRALRGMGKASARKPGLGGQDEEGERERSSRQVDGRPKEAVWHFSGGHNHTAGCRRSQRPRVQISAEVVLRKSLNLCEPQVLQVQNKQVGSKGLLGLFQLPSYNPMVLPLPLVLLVLLGLIKSLYGADKTSPPVVVHGKQLWGPSYYHRQNGGPMPT